MSDIEPSHPAPLEAEATPSSELAAEFLQLDRAARIVGGVLLAGGLGMLHLAEVAAAADSISTYGNLGPNELPLIALGTILATTDMMLARYVYRQFEARFQRTLSNQTTTEPGSYDAAYIIANPPYTLGTPTSTDRWLYAPEQQ